jgi:hypothetical protein
VVEPVSERQVIRSAAWKADWHVLDLSRTAGGGWDYTLCRLMLRGAEQVPMGVPGKGFQPSCPLCIAEFRKEVQAGPSS